MEYLHLTWSNWSHISEFIGKENFIYGVYLDDITIIKSKSTSLLDLLMEVPITRHQRSYTIGLYIKIDNEPVLVKENDFIIKENNNYKVMTELQFKRKRKLEQICQGKN